MTTSLDNAKQFPRVFYARHMESGTAKYDKETILVSTDAMKEMANSFAGKPVYVYHQEVDLENLKEKADGYVADCFYNEMDGWLWSKIIAVDDEAIKAISNKWSVSNAYIPTNWKGNGTHHNVPYDREITNAEFTHLAIVPNPRYEGACVMSPDEFKTYQANNKAKLEEMRNSKPSPEGSRVMFFTKEKKEVSADNISPESFCEIKNEKGETVEVTLAELTKVYLNAQEKAAKKIDADAVVKIGDKEVKISELQEVYLNAKKNMAEEEDVDDEMENTDEEDEKKNEEEEKKNSKKRFEEMQNAHKKSAVATVTIDTTQNQMARGKSRYGSGNK